MAWTLVDELAWGYAKGMHQQDPLGYFRIFYKINKRRDAHRRD